MSIKIYDGLRAAIKEPFELAEQIQNVLDPVFLEYFKSAYIEAKSSLESDPASTWESIFHTGGTKEIDKYSIDFDLYQIVENLQKSDRFTYSKLDFGYELTLHSNATGGNPLVLIFGTKSREYAELLINAGVLEEYGYWNNTDMAEGVSLEEWEEREIAWSKFADPKLDYRGLVVSMPSRIESCVSLYPKFS